MLNLSESGELAAFWSSKYQMLPGKLFGILQRRLFERMVSRGEREAVKRDRISRMATGSGRTRADEPHRSAA